MSAEHVIEIARGELGYSESPTGSNRVKYWEPYGAGWQGQAWCVAFLYWCFRQAGEAEAFYGGGKTASCSALLRRYREEGRTVPAEEVRPGDIVILNFHGTGDTEHCGLVEQVYDNPVWGRNMDTIEGNTTPGTEGSQDNGGCVARKMRFQNQIVAVCRPQYTADPPKPDYAGHWAEEAIRWAITRGLMEGYEDGSFRPDAPVTRGELATVLYRLGVLE